MTVLKTWTVSAGVVISILCLLAVGAPQASASLYEWISTFTSVGSCCSSGAIATFKWRTNVSDPLNEYASLYYFVAASTTLPGSIGDNTNWVEWTNCRTSGVISTGYRQEKCSVTLPPVTEDKRIFIRPTTQYAGCGTWTPAPNVTTCGDSYTTFFLLSP